MRDLFGEWESVEGEKVTLESLGDMEQLVEVREETELVENEMTESVENFKVSLAKLDELCAHADVCEREREREREGGGGREICVYDPLSSSTVI